MNPALLKGLVALVPVLMLLAGSAVLFVRSKTVWSFLQLFGAGYGPSFDTFLTLMNDRRYESNSMPFHHINFPACADN